MKTSIESKQRSWKPFLATAGVVLALAGGWAWRQAQRAAPATPPAPPAPAVTVAPVEERSFVERAEFTGRVDALETVEVRPRVSGHLTAVKFQSGQRVAQGEVLFEIDPRWYRAQEQQAAAEVARARSAVDVARRDDRRTGELSAARTISSEEADARRLRATTAEAALQAAVASHELAKLDLEHTVIRAPIAGRISRALVTPGNLVSGTPANATLLATLVSAGDAYVYADLDELTALKFQRLLRENSRLPVELELADERGYPRRGWLESTDIRLVPSTGSLVLRAVFANEDGALIPGLFARIRVPVSGPQTALLISERAIGTDQSQKFVLTVNDQRTVAARPVKLGGSIDGYRIVREGLKPGESVVVNGLQRVRPGMTVAPELAAPAASVAQR